MDRSSTRVAAVSLGGAAAAAAVGWYYLSKRARAQKSTGGGGSYVWGWFTGPLGLYTRPEPATLIVLGSKLPVAKDGPLIWLAGEPETLVGAAHTFVPVGRNAYAVDGGSIDSGLVQSLIDRHSASAGSDHRWASTRDLLGLPARGRATQIEVEAVVRAASLLAWHRSHAFNGADGSPTTMDASAGGRRRALASGRRVYPRVDPVAIVLVESADGERCLLGRQRNYLPNLFTCISGFVEHGESAECAAAREVLEETSVRCSDLRLVASQPWPCGRGNSCELMLAVAARAAPDGEAIDVNAAGGAGGGGGGGELESAHWFSRAEVRRMLEGSAHRNKGSTTAEGAHFVPPALAIAHHLIARWEARSL
jgi:NADH pyrophosphatase NudC (nudix superfamily)